MIDPGWKPDFPKVLHFIDIKNCCAKPWKLLTAIPDYDAAKNHEDRDAALRVVKHILSTSENIVQLASVQKKYPGSLIVPVRAVEAGGKNKLPAVFAEYIAKKLKLDLDRSIVQSNKVFHTGSHEYRRFAFRAQFQGPVERGRRYILVDDVFTSGGTFGELRRHIELNGGTVALAASLALGGHGDSIAPAPDETKIMLDKHGEKNICSFLKEIDVYGGNYKCLTCPETFFLRRAASLNDTRDRILAARREGNPRMGENRSCGRETPHRSFSR